MAARTCCAAWSRCSGIRRQASSRCWCWTTGPRDGTAAAVDERFGDRVEIIALRARRGKAENDSALMTPRARELVPAAERGLRADAGGGGRAARCTPARSAGRRRGRPPRIPGWCTPAVGLAVPGRPGRAGRRRVRTPPAHRPESRRADAGGGLGAVGGDARATRRVRAGGAARPRFLRVLGRGRLAAARPRRGLVGPVRPGRDDHAPRAALAETPGPGGGSSSSRATATPTCASTTAGSRRWRCGR